MKHIYTMTAILSIIIILFTCTDKPTEPGTTNPFDPQNTETTGDPFRLEARIANGGITLTWTKPNIEGIANFKIYRSEQEAEGYTELDQAASGVSQYVDKTAKNGHSYWYRVSAIDSDGKETQTTNTEAVNIKTEPLIVINGGDEYTPTKEVSLTILANTATQMIISNNEDLNNANWEDYSTSKAWSLLPGAGVKTVYMKVKYDNGNESPVVNTNILPQPMEPSIVIIADSVEYSPVRDVTVNLTAEGSNLQMKLSEDSTFTGVDWQSYSESAGFQLSTGDGDKVVYARIKNDFEMETGLLDDDITLDTTPPVIRLRVSPDSGITDETAFAFDPTASSDNLAEPSAMEIRFDYDDDGTFDSGWGALAVSDHVYDLGGGDNNVTAELRDGAGWTADTTITLFVNTRPVASFIATQDASNYLLYHFDASASSDYEDGGNLEYRWDFDGDGNWDTDYNTSAKADYEYAASGDYAPVLTVRDQNKLGKEKSTSINVFDGTVTDIDGNVYQAVKIGDQWWMAENLKVTHYRNGDAIAHVTDNTEWTNLSSGAWCVYDNNDGNTDTYGLLYNWYAVDDSRNIAPEGWHVPTDEEWKELEMYLGMSQSEADDTGWRGTDEGGKLKATGTEYWNSPNEGATNESGFSALPGGCRYFYSGYFYFMGFYGYWWSSTEASSTSAWNRGLYCGYSDVCRSYDYKRYGFSVRCLRD